VNDEAEAAFEAMYRAEFQAVLRFVAARIAPDCVYDVVADTFIAAWQSMDKLPLQVRPWLFAVARNKLVDAQREAVRRSSLVDRLIANPRQDIADHAGEVGERDAILRALRSLSAPDQDLLMLVAWDRATRSEAAKVLGCSVAVLTVRLHRARHRLREAMSQAQYDEGSEARSSDHRALAGGRHHE
jgi:RNA polymerase sigma-70 factor, ECF subfamily